MTRRPMAGPTNYMADAYALVSAAASATVSGLDHLEGENVVVWNLTTGAAYMTGDVPTTFTVTSGAITLPASTTADLCVGLAYTWQWQSSKLAYGVQDGTPISRRKQVRNVSPLLYKTHIRGIQYGQDFVTMDYLPLISANTGTTEDTSKVYDAYDPDSQVMPGAWDTDARICLQGTAPLPCTVLGIALTVDAN